MHLRQVLRKCAAVEKQNRVGSEDQVLGSMVYITPGKMYPVSNFY